MGSLMNTDGRRKGFDTLLSNRKRERNCSKAYAVMAILTGARGILMHLLRKILSSHYFHLQQLGGNMTVVFTTRLGLSFPASKDFSVFFIEI